MSDIASSGIGIVGLDCAYGSCDDLEAFARAIYAGSSLALLGTSPRVSVAEVVARSVRRYGLEQALSGPMEVRPRLGVVTYGGVQVAQVVSGLPSRASEGPGVVDERTLPTGRDVLLLRTLSSDAFGRGAELAQALVLARDWLETKAVDLVWIVGRDLLGVGILLLARVTSVSAGRVYATIADVASGPREKLAQVCAESLNRAGIASADVGYLESTGWPLSPGILSGYTASSTGGDLTCAVGNLGLPEEAPSSMAALIKGVLCLDRRMLPPTPSCLDALGDCSLGTDRARRHTPFYVIPEARPWFAPVAPASAGGSRPRVAVVVSGNVDRVAHLILSEPGPHREAPMVRPHLTGLSPYLIPIAASSKSELLARLATLRDRVAPDPGASDEPRDRCERDLSDLARRAFAAYQADAGAPYALAIVGRNLDEILRDIDFALDGGVERAFAVGKDWQTPRGSAFTASPLGPGGIAFVYPGAFNSYIGLGRDLFQHFPRLHERLADLVSDLGRATASGHLYPRSRYRLGDVDLRRRMEALIQDPPALIESGTIFAVAYTMILREFFGVEPDAALGYSLGEMSMLWAAGVWRDGDRGGAALHESSLFRTRIAGPKEAIREHWGLDAGEEVSWATFLLKAPATEAQQAVAHEPQVYLTLINQADEVVIAGDEAGCRRVIKALDCHSLPIPYEVALHNVAMHSAYEALVDLYSYPVIDRPEITFYSAAHYGPLELEREALAHAMAKMTCRPVDFPRLVKQVYADGARIFVESGPLATCTRRIGRILQDEPHVAVAVNPSPDQGLQGVLGTLAQLLTHRVPMDISPLYRQDVPGNLVIRPRAPWAESDEPLRLHLRTGAAHLHQHLLENRAAAQRGARSLIELQMRVGRRLLNEGEPGAARATVGAPATPLFDKEDLREFAEGNIVKCFGPDFAVYQGRRLPRIPNGDLLLMDRIVEIDGQPGDFAEPAMLRSEVDVSHASWFYQGSWYRGLPPYAVLMEMALQPCGFLSAYLRSSLLDPERDLYFRNLDGHGRVLADIDLRGRTITDEVHLVSSTRGQGTILQSYTFALSCEGQRFYEGWASFGYFPKSALARQTGVDGGTRLSPEWAASPAIKAISPALEPAPHRLRLLDDVSALPQVDEYPEGYLRASGCLSPHDWFFRAHFHEDPVMPGSLGIEAAMQAMRAYARWRHPELIGARVTHPVDHQMTWKYRGQITPDDRRWELSVHVSRVEENAESLTLIGDADVWKRGLRIYEVKDIAVRLNRPRNS
ncbi:MAG: PfaB family protein [Anaerolineae bacterium]